MRRFVMTALVALAAGTMPAMVRADEANPNTAAAKKVCAQLRESGQLGGRRIDVRYLDGTIWLQGKVASQEQYNKIIAAVMLTPSVTISRVIPDALVIESRREQGRFRRRGEPAPRHDRRIGRNRQRYAAAFRVLDDATGHSDGDDAGRAGAARAAGRRSACRGRRARAEPLAGADRRYDRRRARPALADVCSSAAAAGPCPVRYDRPAMPAYAWPSYAAYPNYAAVTYPKQYSPTAWPYIGPFYPYPQVPLGWRKVNLQWDDGWWWLDFKDKCNCCWWR